MLLQCVRVVSVPIFCIQCSKKMNHQRFLSIRLVYEVWTGEYVKLCFLLFVFFSSQFFIIFFFLQKIAHSRDLELAPLAFQSDMIERDLILIHSQFHIPPEFQFDVLEVEERVCNPPPGRIDVYEECFWVGLRFSLHPFFIILFHFLRCHSTRRCRIHGDIFMILLWRVFWLGSNLASSFFIIISLLRGIMELMVGGT